MVIAKRDAALGFPFAVILLLTSIPACADPSRIFWSASGNNLGDDTVRAYVGSSSAVAMISYQGGVLTAFRNAGPHGHRIHWSGNGESLGGGPIRYDGSSPVTAMAPFERGVLTAFSNAGGHGHRIWYSPDGTNLGGGELRYDGSSPVKAMIPYGGGVLVAFSNAGGNGHRIWFSPNGRGLGGGELRYDGSSPVEAMIPYNGGVLTAFSQAGGRNRHRIHWSPDGRNLGGGPAVYDGGSPVVAMIPYNRGVLTAFTNAGPHGNRIHWSPDGNNLGGGPIHYDGSTRVLAMLPYKDGVLTSFQGEGSGRKCGGWQDVPCHIGEAIGVAGRQVGQLGREIDRKRLELFASVLSGPALEQWLRASRDDAINGAMPMPAEMRRALQGWYSPSLMDKVRYRVGDGGELSLANNSMRFGHAAAVTLIDVIVFRGPSEANDPALWAHEMKHIEQFDEWGVHSFAVQYMRSSNTVENPAYEIQTRYNEPR